MSAHHFFVTDAAGRDGIVTLEGAEAHHAARVLRIRVGESITVADDSGRIVFAVVTSVGDVVEAEIRSQRRIEMPRPAITLCQALTKGDKIDHVIEKATEVGIRRVVPFVAERTIVKWDEAKLARAHERWCAIAKGAAKQSRAPWIPVVDHVALTAGTSLPESGTKLVLHEGADTRLRDALIEPPPDDLALLVGPEGGLSDAEIAEVRDAGAQIVTLGPRVLRTETAGPIAAAVVGYAYGWLG